jgi:hypothetical protein
VSGEPEAWLISADGEWRSVGDERRYLKALRRYPHAAVFVAERADGALVGRLSVARDTHPASAHVADLGLMVAKDGPPPGRGVGAPGSRGRLGPRRGCAEAGAARLPVERARDPVVRAISRDERMRAFDPELTVW